MRDRDFYRKLFTETEHDPVDDGDLDKLIKFIAMLGDKTEDDGELEDDYETMDPEEFLKKALGEDGDDGDDDEDDDDDDDGGPWRFNKDEEHNAAGGEGIDSVGDDGDGDEDDGLTVSDRSKKDKPKKDGGFEVSDRGMKKVRRRRGPSEGDLTRRNIAAALRDLRF